MTGPEQLLTFWFADSLVATADLGVHQSRWFHRDAALDRGIAEQFGELLEQARRGDLDGWARTPRGRLALIVLMDQFSRNIFRDSGHAFALDARAAQLCLAGLERGDDRALQAVERLFFYLPLLHSERPTDQARSVACFRRLAADAHPRQFPYFAAWLREARRSRLVIRLFGRYPHRNAVLGRRSGLGERLFLSRGRMRRFARRLRRRLSGAAA